MSYQFDFLKTYRKHIEQYKHIPLPVVITDSRLTACYANELMQEYFPRLATIEGIRRILAELSPGQLESDTKAYGSVTIREIIPYSNLGMKVVPIGEGGETTGFVLMLTKADNLTDPGTLYRTANMPSALSDSIREVVGDIFAITKATGYAADQGLLGSRGLTTALGNITGNGYKIMRVANNLSEYAAYQSELLNLDLQSVELNSYFERNRTYIQDFAAAAGADLTFDIPERDFFVLLDCTRSEHAFYNILHNALYYSRPGNRVKISLRTKRSGGKDKEFILTVADSGIGIPTKALPDITKPYYTSGYHRGRVSVGLGLTIADLTVKAHGGSMEIRSAIGRGTTVKLHLLPDNGEGDSYRLSDPAQDIITLRDKFSPLNIGLGDLGIGPYPAAPPNPVPEN